MPCRNEDVQDFIVRSKTEQMGHGDGNGNEDGIRLLQVRIVIDNVAIVGSNSHLYCDKRFRARSPQPAALLGFSAGSALYIQGVKLKVRWSCGVLPPTQPVTEHGDQLRLIDGWSSKHDKVGGVGDQTVDGCGFTAQRKQLENLDTYHTQDSQLWS
ncbi:hypothetical protein BJ508DRAFT_303890 [Ascobolus immersus RN42]|uniref:Uncharacterized protein n=1 Tax=Ascobolus immersus RN42 TaxID=1160509 RepID=A0A3N4II95_ASCIM|nr:hypothetical protein BJ508DRAFT_303890 [Ascobolus immersus RN42]